MVLEYNGSKTKCSEKWQSNRAEMSLYSIEVSLYKHAVRCVIGTM